MSFDGINRRRQEKLKKLTAPVPPAPKKSTGNGATHVTGSFVWGRATYPVVETPEMRALAASLGPVGPSSPVAQGPSEPGVEPARVEEPPQEPPQPPQEPPGQPPEEPSGGTAPPVEPQPITVTRITNDGGLLAKRFWLKDGELTKSTRAFLKRGRADRIKVDGLEGLTELLASLTHKQALAYGITTKKSVPLVTKDEQAAHPGSLARTNENFSWPAGPAILMLDHDAEHVEGIYTPETLRAVLLEAEPELAHAPMMWTASSSSYIVNADEDEVVIPLRGQRIYIPVVDGRDIPRVLGVIYERLWLAGFGCFIVSGSGRLVDRNIIDASVGQPERLDFAAGAMCVPPLEQRRPEPRIWGDPNVLFDTRRIADLTPQEHKDVEDLRRAARALRSEEAARVNQAWVEQHVARLVKRGVAPDRARELTRAATEGQELTAEFQLVSKDGEVVTVREVLDDPDKWHGKHFADPIEPGYRGDGRIAYANLQGGRPYIYSHAHGGVRYELARKSVMDEFADIDAELADEIEAEALVSTPEELQARIADVGLAGKERAALIARVKEATGVEIAMPAPQRQPLKIEQLYAYLPQHMYIYRPTRDLWPAASVDGHIRGKRDGLKSSTWLDKNRAVTQMTWWPGRGETIEDYVIAASGWITHPGQRVYNLYRPPLAVRGDANDVAPWLGQLRRIYPEDTEHIVSWLAQRVQFPHVKLNHALVLLGDQGIGKDTTLEPAKRAVGPWNWGEIAPSEVFEPFNPWVRSVVLRVNESRDMGDSGAVNRFVMYERMKGLCVAPPDVLNCNDKHIRKFPVVNVVGPIITSNHKADCLYLPADDRRHYVASSTAKKEDFTTDYWNALWGWYERGGFANVAEYLRTYDLSGFDPKAPPPKTEAFWRIVAANADPGDSALADLLEEMGDPAAVTIEEIKVADMHQGAIDGPHVEWLDLPQAQVARRAVHFMERAGYVPVRNSGQKDGRWRLGGVGGRNVVVFAKSKLSLADQLRAVHALVEGSRGRP